MLGAFEAKISGDNLPPQDLKESHTERSRKTSAKFPPRIMNWESRSVAHRSSSWVILALVNGDLVCCSLRVHVAPVPVSIQRLQGVVSSHPSFLAPVKPPMKITAVSQNGGQLGGRENNARHRSQAVAITALGFFETGPSSWPPPGRVDPPCSADRDRLLLVDVEATAEEEDAEGPMASAC